MRRRWIWIALLAGMALLLPTAVGAAAGALPTHLSMTARPDTGTWVALEAKLVGSDGKPVGNAEIVFERTADFFGRRSLVIGKARTDSAGMARTRFRPGGSGEQSLQAIFAGNDKHAAAQAQTTYVVTSPANLHTGEASLLTPVWRLTAAAAGTVTVLVWLILIGTLVVVRVGMVRRAAEPRYALDPAMDSESVKGD